MGETTDVGGFYHQWSKLGFSSVVGSLVRWGNPLPPYKDYPDAPRVQLPPPKPLNRLSLEEAIERRRSIRDYAQESMSLEELSLLLHLADGITAHKYGIGFRAAPSAGALYPIEIYPVVNRVEGLAPGIYHYNVRDHALEILREGDFRGKLVQYCLGQEMPGMANVVLILTAIFQRTRWKYRERTYRYVMLEAGHIGENIYLAATAMGMGACAIGAFLDEPINHLLDVDGVQEAVVYLLTVGKI
ncbi:MAG TPA: SagB/ThcOx family dehydrogenase [Chloroflexi bacterium]|nr:SagB/ThcOx family dehydrogenase [Chloroflexota bacterium]